MRLRRKDHQAGPAAGAVVAAPSGKRAARAGLVQRIKGAIVRRQVAKAAATIPPAAALAVGLAIGIAIGAALMLSTLAQLVKEQQ